jgi:hypothetical protein
MGVPPAAWLTRTRQFGEAEAGTVQAKLPEFGTEAATAVQFSPPSVESSILTSPTVPLVVQATARDDPASQVSPPLGEARVIVFGVAAAVKSLPGWSAATEAKASLWGVKAKPVFVGMAAPDQPWSTVAEYRPEGSVCGLPGRPLTATPPTGPPAPSLTVPEIV